MNITSENFGNRFEIRRELGKGTYGEVHLAFDNFLQRKVAIKIIRRKESSDPEADRQNRSLWLNETRLAGKLLHPFIVQVMEAGSTDEFDYLIMEYVAGGTLKRFTASGKLLPIDRVIDVLYKVCNALDYANRLGVLHRDIKPENILLAEHNAIKISDFGAAYCNDSDVTQVLFVGSLAFMPPELFRKETPTLKSDIYAVGVMAYQLLTGTLPFTADSHEGLILEKLTQDAVPMERRRQDIPASLRFAVHRAMHRDKDVRYDSWKDFCDDLAIALPQIPRPAEVSFDSAHFNALRNLSFFERFSDVELWETVGISSWQHKQAGEVIVEEDVTGRSLFVILGGEARVSKKNIDLNVIHADECFGEMAYLDESQPVRSATVTAITDISMIEIEGESLRQATGALQARFSNAFLRLMVSRLKNADQRFLSGVGFDA